MRVKGGHVSTLLSSEEGGGDSRREEREREREEDEARDETRDDRGNVRRSCIQIRSLRV